MQGIEPLLQFLRINQAKKYLKPNSILVDLGCDYEMTLIKKYQDKMKKCIGVDSVIQPARFQNVQIIKADITRKLPIDSNSADIVTMLAVLEHLPNPEVVMKEVYRILKPGGRVVITVPSKYSKFWLEKVLAPLHLVRRDMINQHENYFTPTLLNQIAQKVGLTQIEAHYFEVIFNTFLIARKPIKIAGHKGYK